MVNSKVYQVYLEFIEDSESTKKKVYTRVNSEGKWTRKLVRVNELTRVQ